MNTEQQQKNISLSNNTENATLREKINISCPTPNKLVIKGSDVKFSDFIKSDGKLENLCKNGAVLNAVDVFALQKVLIDADLQGIGDELRLTVIAPEWEVKGIRSIVLDGSPGIEHSPHQARDGTYAGSSGQDGKPGLPGGPAGSFFGIGAEFVNGANLTITANGGKGAEGQCAGNGADGKDGESPELPIYGDSPDKYSRLTTENYSFHNEKCSAYSNQGACNSGVSATYLIHGTRGAAGGNGGDGGIGGLGGNPGNISFISLGYNAGLPRTEMEKGNGGWDGYGGIGGIGGRNGYAVRANYEFEKIRGILQRESKSWKILKKDILEGSADNGNEGNCGANAYNRQSPTLASTIKNPAYIINNFKSYLRENLNDPSGGFKKYSLIQFLNQLDSDSQVKNAYDALGLVNELQGLERQRRVLSKEDLISSYQSILARINEYAKTPKASENSNQYKQVLNYLYTAALSRLYNLEADSGANLIINITDYLLLVEKNIKNIETLQGNSNKVNVITQYREHYKANLDKKIDEAKMFIENQITPDIDKNIYEIDNKIDVLIGEIRELKAQAKEEKQDLINKERELENALVLRKSLSAFKLIGQAASFLGPIGSAAGLAIGATSAVTEALVLDDQTSQQKSLQLPSAVNSNLKLVEAKIKTIKDRKVASFNRELEEISQEITAYKELDDLSKSVASMQKELEKNNPYAIDDEVLNKVEKSYNELKENMKVRERELKTQKTTIDKKNANTMVAIRRANQIVQFSTVGFDIYSKYKAHQAELDIMSEAIQQSEEKFQKINSFETIIYNTTAPMLKNMRRDLKDIESKLATKSHVALDIANWQVQSTLKDIRLQMQQVTEGFNVQGSFLRHIEKLAEAMRLLIAIYDRIQNYQDQQNLASYIAHINSPVAKSTDISDIKLSNAMNDLELIIRSNLVLEQYEVAVNSLKQWVFPCADNYLRELVSPQHLRLDGNIHNLASEAIKQIMHIKEKVENYKTAVKDSDTYMHSGAFNSELIATKPFFVWDNKRHKDSLFTLLSGEEIIVNADIANSPFDKDAIKFNWIDIHFKSANKTIQAELNEKLKGFKVRAIHLGNSRYRYKDEIYLINSAPQTVEYSFEKNANAAFVHTNTVYDKLRAGDFMLSPYAMWKFKLINVTTTISFHALEKYKDTVDLELVGYGSYVTGNACPRVGDYYSAIRSPEQSKSRKKRRVNLAELNTNEKTQKGLQPVTIFPYYQNSLINLVTTQRLSSSQMESTAQITTLYGQMEIFESYPVFKWLCGLFGKRSVVGNLNKIERVGQAKTAIHPLDEIEDKVKQAIAICENKYGDKPFVSQEQSGFSNRNRVPSKNPLLFFKARLAQSIANKTSSYWVGGNIQPLPTGS